jgi:SpoVK/Ycf46/Vps4 family AAA+-type ATPase
MAEPVSLEDVNRRIGELVREYYTMKPDDARVADIVSELSRLLSLSGALKKSKTRLAVAATRFPTLEALYREMDSVARDIAETPRSDPRRHALVDELTAFTILADRVRREKKE